MSAAAGNARVGLGHSQNLEYSILCAFFVLWIYVELFPRRNTTTQFIRLICLVALFLNVIGVTPLMDGLRDHFDVTTRLLLYAPVLTIALGLAWSERHAVAPLDPTGRSRQFAMRRETAERAAAGYR